MTAVAWESEDLLPVLRLLPVAQLATVQLKNHQDIETQQAPAPLTTAVPVPTSLVPLSRLSPLVLQG